VKARTTHAGKNKLKKRVGCAGGTGSCVIKKKKKKSNKEEEEEEEEEEEGVGGGGVLAPFRLTGSCCWEEEESCCWEEEAAPSLASASSDFALIL